MSTMQHYTKPFEWILNDRLRIAFHVLFWTVMYLDELLSFVGITSPYYEEYVFYVVRDMIVDIILVYVNFYVLIPRLLLKNMLGLYIVATLTSILIVNFINIQNPDFSCNECEGPGLSDFLIGTFIPTLTLLGTAIAVKIFKIYLQNQGEMKEMETSKLKTELAYLKDQVNPHFLFNALNNIYVQSRKRPEEASESILLLSDLLRYQLYDCAKEKVYLSHEIEYLKNYLRLDKLRKTKAEIDFEIKGNPNGKMVAPFLFLPFIENAVKHGLSMDSESFMKISFDLTGAPIHFTIKNSKPEKPTQELKGGIGLTNVKRRLNLLYPEKHELNIQDDKESYLVELTLLP